MSNPALLSHLIERLARVLQNDGHCDGLKPTQWEVLRYLSRANRFSRTPGAVTAYLGMTKGTVSQTILALERKGLVRKAAAATDQRSVQLELTRQGRNALRNDPAALFEEVAASMTGVKRSQLSSGLETVLKTLLERREGRPFGACRACRHFRKRHARGSPHFCSLLEEPLSVEDGEQICIEQEAA